VSHDFQVEVLPSPPPLAPLSAEEEIFLLLKFSQMAQQMRV
jgi:hypothetical protein